MRYFLTGAAGFIGSNFVEHLFVDVKKLTGVTIYDKFTYAANSKNFNQFAHDSRLKVVKGDICDVQLLSESMREHDVVIHFAAESHVDRSIIDASTFISTNVLGTFNVLEASRKNGIKTVVHVSTDEVYGSIATGSAGENDLLQPNSPYAASKASSDLLARSYFITHGLDVRTTRCCNNFGKYQYPEKVIPVYVDKLIHGNKLPIYGDGANVREWIHVSDHVKAIQVVVERGTPGAIYNIGSGVHLSNNELASKIIELMDLKQDMKTFVPDRKGHDFRYSIDSSKIKELGFVPEVEFEGGLLETINWYVSNPKWWA
jgi:dTDP-glucose 4,6-dehydratase